ncbi:MULTISPECIES: hypothetical protein [unclassified Arthrobacter]|uniref:hypothetical protein n=1 Tax=unclassified Arthrobacter TaxID=235627 RepID=UPI001D151FD9|nr:MULTISPECIES: hypothetical protein [unclassified Arthrobacter]MCC3274685.1 hypothetical protein [Arthrobacter sp. zg-Y20]MCC3279345.1 hypothetical protein [Arthrobacter sp. zg-Y40]MCC9177727.1 hypothetical protein [Arthrobacter sp. zg-Y750]MDK1314841.1 hypothetical protein [Arthrobacter sp. zg.Y20]MDK1327702.1 hypothetical protein [Arthrobacter sp. zg-Y1143]
MTTAALSQGNKTPGRSESAGHNTEQGRDQERVQIRAARLRLTTDRKLGKTTPDWVRKLADRPL